MKKKKENIADFMKRRQKETGKVTIPETKPNPPMAAGSSTLNAKHKEQGIVKKKKAKKLASLEKRMKRRNLGEGV